MNISHLKYCTEVILRKAFCIFIFFHFPDSRLSILNGLHIYFSLRDSAIREYQSGIRTGPTGHATLFNQVGRRPCVYQNTDPVIKTFHNSRRRRTDFKIILQYSYYSLQRIIGVFELIPDDRRVRGFTGWRGFEDF